MRTNAEIREKRESDTQFIISAVTVELHDIAYLKYFDTWENEGGMGWFFDECVEISKKVMFTEGSAYMKWLEYWVGTSGNDFKYFSEFTGNNCFDWYHMNEAVKEFKLRYEEDECTKEQISERIGYLVNSFEVEVDRDEVMDRAIKFASKQRARREELERKKEVENENENKKKAYDKIINDLKELDVDGENMQNILEAVGMEDQMHRQLIVSYASTESTEALLEEAKEVINKIIKRNIP
jgi:hypothetical protein